MKKIVVTLLVIGLLGLLVWAYFEGQKERGFEAERERPVKAPSRVSVQQEEITVSLDPATQQKSGIGVVALDTKTHRHELRAYAQVLEMQDLSDARNGWLSAKGLAEKTGAAAEASRKELDRLKSLQADQNVSIKALQAADAQARSDEATAQPAEAALHVLESSMRQRWGAVLSEWLSAGSPEIDRLLKQEDVLMQVSLPAGMRLSDPPPTATIKGAGGKLVTAHLVSPALRVDPRLQGISLYYIAPAHESGLLPGMAAAALVPAGEEEQGVNVPADAVVWWQGKAWVYVQADAQRFTRREIPADVPVQDGWFVTTGIKAGERIVVKGAQQLLSEEFRSQIEVGEDKK